MVKKILMTTGVMDDADNPIDEGDEEPRILSEADKQMLRSFYIHESRVKGMLRMLDSNRNTLLVTDEPSDEEDEEEPDTAW